MASRGLNLISADIVAGKDVCDEIDGLSWRERVIVRHEVGDNYPQPRNLYYDYERQEWID